VAAGARTALELALGVLLLGLSYLHPPWHWKAYPGVRPQLGRLVGADAAAAVAVAAVALLPLVVLGMAWNATATRRLVERGVPANGMRLVVAGAAALVLVSLALFPFLSHDLELYHAHARMLAEHGTSPYRATPDQVLGEGLSPTMPWSTQRAPYGPVPIALQALAVGGLADPWTAALLLKLLYVVPTVALLWVVGRLTAASPTERTIATLGLTWPPLLVLELGGMGHLEGLFGALVALGLLALARHRPGLASGLLGGAALVKIETLILLPVVVGCLWGSPPHRRTGVPPHWRWTLPAVVAVVLVAGYLPLGGLEAGLAGLRAEAAKLLRSVPQAVAYLGGWPASGGPRAAGRLRGHARVRGLVGAARAGPLRAGDHRVRGLPPPRQGLPPALAPVPPGLPDRGGPAERGA